MVYGLCQSLNSDGRSVSLIMPFYQQVEKEKLESLRPYGQPFPLREGEKIYMNQTWRATVENIPLFLIQTDHHQRYFLRQEIYGEPDDPDRFLYFSKAALHLLSQQPDRVDILHLHDWMTGCGALLYRMLYSSLFHIKGLITTIHNMSYQGICDPSLLVRLGITEERLASQPCIWDAAYAKKVNLLSSAIGFSDRCTTVSPSYAQELKENPTYHFHGKALQGILNGIDLDFWNPQTDPYLAQRYQPASLSMEEILRAKMINRRAFYHRAGVHKSCSSPLVISITRLVEQKGPQLIRFGLKYTLKKGGSFTLLGSTPDPAWRTEFMQLEQRYRGHPNLYLHFQFDEGLAHLLFASADYILIPSNFEPCGLTQMIALRYATIPIVHQTGGLKDTVYDIDQEPQFGERCNGYTFAPCSSQSLAGTLDRVFAHFCHNHSKRFSMIRNGIDQLWGWEHSVRRYLSLYQQLM